MTIGEFFNISALDPLLPTFLIATLCLCALSVITYYSLVIAWEVFWASRRSPSLLDPSAEVILTPWWGERLRVEKIKGRQWMGLFSLLFHHGFCHSELPSKVLLCARTNLGFKQKLSLLKHLSIFNPSIFNKYDPVELGICEEIVMEYQTSLSTNGAVCVSGSGGAKVWHY